MSIRMIGAVTLIMLILLPVSVATAGGETGQTLRIAISPISGEPGTGIAVTGSFPSASLIRPWQI